jgi:hypothetical protein
MDDIESNQGILINKVRRIGGISPNPANLRGSKKNILRLFPLKKSVYRLLV